MSSDSVGVANPVGVPESTGDNPSPSALPGRLPVSGELGIVPENNGTSDAVSRHAVLVLVGHHFLSTRSVVVIRRVEELLPRPRCHKHRP